MLLWSRLWLWRWRWRWCPEPELVLLVLVLVLAGAASPLAWSALHAAGSSSAGRRGGAGRVGHRGSRHRGLAWCREGTRRCRNKARSSRHAALGESQPPPRAGRSRSGRLFPTRARRQVDAGRNRRKVCGDGPPDHALRSCTKFCTVAERRRHVNRPRPKFVGGPCWRSKR